jgi:RNA polymerase sigma factor (sigma-70 family)
MLMNMSDTDLELLARYTRHHAEDAFAEIVRRHLNLVHSAALRQVRSPQLAEEVAQSAFVTLARQAHRLAPDTILSAWLYQVTRCEAIDVVRREARRQLREQIATEMNAINATTADWSQIEPLLDEAMHALDDTDRTAVLLRYFENKSLREVGATLGTTDDTAQKRVSRAVERLREFFTKHGFTISGTGLIVVISANAVQAAPVGLAATISTAVALAGTTTVMAATATMTKAVVMTALQKTLITAALAAAVGTGIYEARQASNLRTQMRTLRAEQTGYVQRLKNERDDATRQLARLRDDNERLNRNTAELLKLRGQVGGLLGELADAKRRANQSDSPTDDLTKTWVIGGIKWTPASTDLGLGSPDAAVQTYWWAVANTNSERLKQAMVFDRLTNCIPVSDLFAKRESRANQGFYQGGVWAARLAAVTQDSPYRGRLQIEWMVKNPPGGPSFDPADPPKWNPERTETLTVMRNDLDGEWKIVGDEHRVILTIDDEDSEAVAKAMIQMDPRALESMMADPRLPSRTLRAYEALKAKAAK